MIWPDQQGCRPVERGVAILTQSSNIGMTLTMQQRGIADCLSRLSWERRADRAGGFGGGDVGG